ncbi:MAG: polysaccharide deacetylase family protein [Planctomycetes bacterium]|nr:polysaccharide deacetylase family protein [Planctomycetota bacterium]MBI3843458.1 polysaccharide deacetylase family protein [Planctomycetota bacterium]
MTDVSANGHGVPERRIVNIIFHGVGEPSRPLEPDADDLWLTPTAFATILDGVRDRDDVQITFDDGNASDIEVALPALVARDLTAEFFILAGKLDESGYLSRDDVRVLAESGMRIGSHGMFHRPWRGLSEAALREELVDARTEIEQVVGVAIRDAACPFGAYDRRVLHRLRESGYEHVFTTDPGPATSGAWLQPRNTIRRGHDPADVGRVLDGFASGSPEIIRWVKLAVKRWR